MPQKEPENIRCVVYFIIFARVLSIIFSVVMIYGFLWGLNHVLEKKSQKVIYLQPKANIPVLEITRNKYEN